MTHALRREKNNASVSYKMYTINPFSEHIVSRKSNLENLGYVSFINLIIKLKT